MTQNRNPRGVPTGGQFAAQFHAEAEGITLVVDRQEVDPRQRLYDIVDEYDSIEEFEDPSDESMMLAYAMTAARAMRDGMDGDALIAEGRRMNTARDTTDLIEQIRDRFPDAKTAMLRSADQSADGDLMVSFEVTSVSDGNGVRYPDADLADLAEDLEDNEFLQCDAAYNEPEIFGRGRALNLDLDTCSWTAEDH